MLQKKYISENLSLLGLDLNKFIWFTKPTKIKSVVVPEPAYVFRSHVYSLYPQAVFKKAIQKVVNIDKITRTEQPLYFSRSLVKINKSADRYVGEQEKKLEQILSDNGFLIIHPHHYSTKEKIELLNKHKNVLGIIGSGMVNIVYSAEPITVIDINHQNHFLRYSYNPQERNWGIGSVDLLLHKCSQYTSIYLNAITTNLSKKVINKGLSKLKLDNLLLPNHLDIDLICHYLAEKGWIKP